MQNATFQNLPQPVTYNAVFLTDHQVLRQRSLTSISVKLYKLPAVGATKTLTIAPDNTIPLNPIMSQFKT
jgi:hypothetical protein